VPGEFVKRVERAFGSQPRAFGWPRADLAFQLNQGRVDLEQQQGRARGRGAPQRATAIDYRNPVPLASERIGDECAANSGADHQDVGLQVSSERPGGRYPARIGHPNGSA
jgi:hypothetical protein